MQLFPPIALFALMLLVPWFSNIIESRFTSAPAADPHFSFTHTPQYNVERHTAGLGVTYYVNAAEFSPITAELARNFNKPGPKLRGFEEKVENVYKSELHERCQRGLGDKQRGKEHEKDRQAEIGTVESCDELRRLGLLR